MKRRTPPPSRFPGQAGGRSGRYSLTPTHAPIQERSARSWGSGARQAGRGQALTNQRRGRRAEGEESPEEEEEEDHDGEKGTQERGRVTERGDAG